jgi:hypothetical protein
MTLNLESSKYFMAVVQHRTEAGTTGMYSNEAIAIELNQLISWKVLFQPGVWPTWKLANSKPGEDDTEPWKQLILQGGYPSLYYLGGYNRYVLEGGDCHQVQSVDILKGLNCWITDSTNFIRPFEGMSRHQHAPDFTKQAQLLDS